MLFSGACSLLGSPGSFPRLFVALFPTSHYFNPFYLHRFTCSEAARYFIGFAPALLGIEPDSSWTRTILHLLGLTITHCSVYQIINRKSGLAPEHAIVVPLTASSYGCGARELNSVSLGYEPRMVYVSVPPHRNIYLNILLDTFFDFSVRLPIPPSSHINGGKTTTRT